MTTVPYLSVQLVHIQGPLKGEIQDLGDSEISIGRHPDCQVCFPKDLTTISRVHAKIIREGNRFKLVDQSTNGTYVNGQRLAEAYLKDGDVLMFSEGGPKVSFLTQSGPRPSVPAEPPAAAPHPAPVSRPATAPPSAPGPRISTASTQGMSPSSAPQPAPQEAPPMPKPQPAAPAPSGPVKAPFAIQYGPALKSFQTLPIVIGSGPACDFVIPHPHVSDRHAQIFFTANQYWIKDLTGRNSILLNNQPIPNQAALEPDMQLALSDRGPKFRFIAGGRLAELDEPPPEAPAPPPTDQRQMPPAGPKPESLGDKAGNLFKKFFS